jgi:hypothetical protein
VFLETDLQRVELLSGVFPKIGLVSARPGIRGGEREELSQANKLSRTYAVLLDALNRHRGKGQQKVTVEHVHVHSGGHAIVGAVQTPRGIRRRVDR